MMIMILTVLTVPYILYLLYYTVLYTYVSWDCIITLQYFLRNMNKKRELGGGDLDWEQFSMGRKR